MGSKREVDPKGANGGPEPAAVLVAGSGRDPEENLEHRGARPRGHRVLMLHMRLEYRVFLSDVVLAPDRAARHHGGREMRIEGATSDVSSVNTDTAVAHTLARACAAP